MTPEQLGWALIIFALVGGPLLLIAFVRGELQDRRERAGHNDRDIDCIFWWGDRSGGSLHARCSICRKGE